MKQAERREVEANDINARAGAHNARERNSGGTPARNDLHERTRKRDFGAALSPMPILLSRALAYIVAVSTPRPRAH